MIKELLTMIFLALMVGGILYFGIKNISPEYNYHCHSKNFKVYKSIKPNGNVYLKTKDDCIDIRDIKRRKAK